MKLFLSHFLTIYLWFAAFHFNHALPSSPAKEDADGSDLLSEDMSMEPDDRLWPLRPSRSRRSHDRYRYENNPRGGNSCLSTSKKGEEQSKANKGKRKGKSKSNNKGKGERCNYNKDDVQNITCSSSIRVFETSILVLFNDDAQPITKSEEMALEMSFINVYNGLAFAKCDGYFRRVDNVTIFLSDTRRQLQSISPDASFEATGSCRNCPVTSSGSFSLFDNGFRRKLYTLRGAPTERSLSNIIEINDGRYGNYSAEPDICRCPVSSFVHGRYLEKIGISQTDLVPAAPSVEEFLTAYNDDIQRLIGEGAIENISSIDTLVEMAKVASSDSTSGSND